MKLFPVQIMRGKSSHHVDLPLRSRRICAITDSSAALGPLEFGADGKPGVAGPEDPEGSAVLGVVSAGLAGAFSGMSTPVIDSSLDE